MFHFPPYIATSRSKFARFYSCQCYLKKTNSVILLLGDDIIFNLNEFLIYGSISAVISYLLGSISFSIVLTKLLYKKDIRDFGSGNAGMTNVLRTFGKKAAALTMTGDVVKGIVAVLISKALFDIFTQTDNYYGAYISAICAVLGHVYPVYFGFKGGKAVSVSIGVIAAINPMLVIPLLLVFAVSFLATKMVSVGSVCCAIAYPIFTYVYYIVLGEFPIFPLVAATFLGLGVVFLHRKNISRILSGTEYKFMQKGKDNESSK